MVLGCGYVGEALARRLLAAGCRVGGLTRNPGRAGHLRDLGLAPVIEARLDDDGWHPEAGSGFEAAVNCVSSAGGGLEGYRASYREGQRSALRWARETGVRRYVFTSSTSVYPQDGGVRADESADTSEAPPTGRVLLEAEGLLAQASAWLERWFALRLAGLYGPGRHAMLDRVLSDEGEIPGGGDHHLNMTHRDDAADAILRALAAESAPSGVYNVADASEATKAEVVAWLAEAVGREPPRFNPERTPERVRRRGGRMPDRVVDSRKARETLGWAPRYPDFREGYRAILRDCQIP